MNTHLRILSFIIILSLCPTIAFSGSANNLTKGINSLQIGDQIIKQQVEFVDPGPSGANLIWNYSGASIVNDGYRIDVFEGSINDSTHINCFEHKTTYQYKLIKDTLYLIGYHNRSTIMNFDIPKVILTFPFSYGDTLNGSFHSKGYYCQYVPIIISGINYIVGDATGSIITPESDTIKNVMRIHRHEEFLNIQIDSIKVISDIYQWYSSNIRYPIFETIISKTQKGDSIIDKFTMTFSVSSINEQTIKSLQANSTELNQDDCEVLTSCAIYPNPVREFLNIDYELSKSSSVSFFLCDISGLVYLIVPEKQLNQGIQNEQINTSQLHLGDYVLYIKVEDKVYKRTIIKY